MRENILGAWLPRAIVDTPPPPPGDCDAVRPAVRGRSRGRVGRRVHVRQRREYVEKNPGEYHIISVVVIRVGRGSRYEKPLRPTTSTGFTISVLFSRRVGGPYGKRTTSFRFDPSWSPGGAVVDCFHRIPLNRIKGFFFYNYRSFRF